VSSGKRGDRPVFGRLPEVIRTPPSRASVLGNPVNRIVNVECPFGKGVARLHLPWASTILKG